ncbi:chaperone NapD [Edwardsiella piscicida]|uniref:chaperone NapD n=1 Tax=Edwardsiella piscicida TaxID=1263550 RepID=UPI0002C08197|nr:chaperone NapD [Edwardsiella piscicida]AGH73189.1 Periplasmic nitrate reductase component NapD [Edwardsiella piscicida C07-087]EKS7778875.1 chaperone NapD [Edwardsiella piscicida]EKS7782295.1 chaperone NapD [Edwardsiella piscicida]UCQ25460.1 chaperone NapD [Edwardsiella piscicida]UCQ35605.1 chaperone NapD [Edwardsiella piscicida]
MSSEIWHVCGLVVQARPQSVEAVAQALSAMEETEVAASEPQQGKLVIVMQSEDSGRLLDRIESVRNVAGVLAVSLVYHQQDEQGEDTP